MLHGVQPNRSSTRVEKVIEAGCCSVWSTLTAKCSASLKGLALAAAFDTHTSSSGGSRLSAVKLLAVSPIGRPRFALKAAANTAYRSDAFQPLYFVSDSLENAAAELEALDLARLKALAG